MKKLLAALLLTASSAALAQTHPAPSTQAQEENKKNEAGRVDTGIEATEVLPGLSGAHTQKQNEAALMNKEHAFKVNGTLKRATSGEIILSRQSQNLPDVELDIRDRTTVMLDGKKVVVGEIPEGSQVRASFQLDEDDAVAVELNATSPQGAKKTTR